jgi:hypothetical protein
LSSDSPSTMICRDSGAPSSLRIAMGATVSCAREGGREGGREGERKGGGKRQG